MKVLTLDRPALKEGNVVQKAFAADDIKIIDDAKRQIDFIISSERVDRMGDVIMVNGWDLKEYKKNPVVLFGHASRVPPIGKALNVRKEDGVLKATAEFMPPEISAFADSIYQMYKAKYLRATSVGFIPLKWEAITDDKGDWQGYRFIKSELLEFSCVPIPANPDALMDARSKGINVDPFRLWAEEVLDNWSDTKAKGVNEIYGVSRKGIEAIRRKAAGTGAVFALSAVDQDKLLLANLARAKAQKVNNRSTDMTKVKIELPIGGDKKEFTFDILKELEGAEAITVEVAESDGTKTLNIDSFPQKTLVTAGVFNNSTTEKSFFELKSDTADALAFLVSGYSPDGVLQKAQYDVVGVSESGDTLYANLKSVEVVKVDGGDDDEEEAEGTTGAEGGGGNTGAEGKAAEDDSEEEAAEPEAKTGTEAATTVTTDPVPDPAKAAKDEPAAAEDGDDAVIKDSSEGFTLLEALLEQLEEALDKEANSGQKKSRVMQRRHDFIAGYMREVADRISPKTAPAKTAPVADEGADGDDGITVSDVKELVSGLGPVIKELVKTEMNKQRGRID